MKTWLLCALLSCCTLSAAHGQYKGNGYWHRERVVDHGDTITMIHILPVYVFSRKVDLRRYQKLVEAVRKVYPVAQAARAKMDEMEAELTRLPTKKAQRAYIRDVYAQIKEEYSPVLKKMTRTQGRVLLKLIDREILAGRIAHLRTEPQKPIRQGGRRPDDRTDRDLLRSRTALSGCCGRRLCRCGLGKFTKLIVSLPGNFASHV